MPSVEVISCIVPVSKRTFLLQTPTTSLTPQATTRSSACCTIPDHHGAKRIFTYLQGRSSSLLPLDFTHLTRCFPYSRSTVHTRTTNSRRCCSCCHRHSSDASRSGFLFRCLFSSRMKIIPSSRQRQKTAVYTIVQLRVVGAFCCVKLKP